MDKTRILYVEDEPFLAKIVRETLEAKGYEVCHVEDGNEAFTNFKSFCPDINVLDVMLPGVDGFTIGKEIRNYDRNSPIIFLTAKDQIHDVVNGFSSGGNDYIKKPFSLEELILRIENLLKLSRNRAIIQKENYTIGDLQFSPQKLEIKGPNTTIKLSHRESEILKLLCQQINHAIDRRKILLEIWGDDSFFNSRNLDVYIRKIRKHLEAEKRAQLLTLKGVGYRLIVDNGE